MTYASMRHLGSILALSLATLAPACGTAVTPANDATALDGGTGTSDGGTLPDASPSGDGSVAVDTGAPPTDAGTTGECTVPSECTLRPESCCGTCGAATSTDRIALPVTGVDDYVARVCTGIGCPDCAAVPDPNLFATCTAGACTAVDLHSDPLATCAVDEDCVLAVPQCCACGAIGLGQAVAFNPANGSLATLVCDPDVDCPPCVPDFGALRAICDAGHCTVVPSR